MVCGEIVETTVEAGELERTATAGAAAGCRQAFAVSAPMCDTDVPVRHRYAGTPVRYFVCGTKCATVLMPSEGAVYYSTPWHELTHNYSTGRGEDKNPLTLGVRARTSWQDGSDG